MLFQQCESMFAGAPSSFFNKEVSGTTDVYKALRGTDLLSDGYLATQDLQDIQVKDNKNINKFVLQTGDIVLLARGQSMRCCIVTEEAAQQRFVATANFIVLRLKAEQKAEFLVTFFNSQLGKQALNHSSISSSTNVVKSLSLGGLKKLEVPFPTIEKQNQIAQLFHTNVKAQKAALQLIEEQQKAVEVKVLKWMEEA